MKDLFLLPYAGGTSLIYSEWEIPASINAIALDYKGHGFRIKEPLCDSFDEMVTDIGEQVKCKQKSETIAVFGHSMGGLVAWDVANKLVGDGVNVTDIIISACLPPHLFNEKMYTGMATDEWLIDFLKKYSRVSLEKMETKFFKKNLFPAIKNDYRLISIHRHEKIKRSGLNIACLYGEQDELMPENGMELWNEYTNGSFMLKGFSGEHFYIENKENRKGVVATIESFIKE